MKNVLEYLERSEEEFPHKIAVKDSDGECTYSELLKAAKEAGSYIIKNVNGSRKPVVVFMEKSVRTLQLFFGIVYAGDFYVLVDPDFPTHRIEQIINVLEPEIIITKTEYKERIQGINWQGKIITQDEIYGEIDEKSLSDIREKAIDTDPLYGIFTSGSTGTPKGVVICHRSVIDFMDVFTGAVGITRDDVIGNQAPFDFDVSVKDIYSSIKMGATLVLIPKKYFMFPNAVVDMLDDNNVTTLIWAVSALCLLNRLHGLKYKVPSCINKIMFSGEMMPIKQLNQWKNYYPEAKFINLYGPTEITCNCTYYIVDREFADDERLPMGIPFANERVFLLDDDDNLITPDMENVNGEICVAGTTLALGYYNNPEATSEAFTNNPLNKNYPERIYHTGDLAQYKNGEMFFAGRKDFQIKHMGHRIELEEIDRILGSLDEIERACCFFDEEKNRIVACYIGTDDKRLIIDSLKEKVPEFMIPNVFMNIEEMPLTKNGKTDRGLLKQKYSFKTGVKHGKI